MGFTNITGPAATQITGWHSILFILYTTARLYCVCLLRFTMLYFIACCSFSVIFRLRATMLINLNLWICILSVSVACVNVYNWVQWWLTAGLSVCGRWRRCVWSVKALERQLVERENELHQLTQVKDTIQRSCHPNALPVIKQSFAVLEAVWHRVSNSLSTSVYRVLYS